MEYEVRLSKRAEANLRHIYSAIRVDRSPVAANWFRGLEAAIFSLESLPQRCPITPEKPNVRHLLYGDKPRAYRILYSIDESRQMVNVAQIRHWARRPLDK
jgi:plasmid stabilization system protein ParE